MSAGHSTDRVLTVRRISEFPIVPILVTVLIVMPIIACDLGGQGGPAPMVTITSPTSGARFAVNQEIVVQASASDPSGVVRLELRTNGDLVGGVTGPSPQETFGAGLRWVPDAPGQYTLEVRAINVKQEPTAFAAVIVVVEQETALLPTPTATLVIQPTDTPVVQPPPAPCSPSVTSNGVLNMRAGPGTNYQVIGRMGNGDVAEVTGRNADGTWWQIVFSGIQGWVSAGYTTPSCVEGVPVIGPPPPPPPEPPAPVPPPAPAINFRADRTSFNAGECTTIRWDVDNVKAVYYNDGSGDQGVGGHETRTVCPTATTTYHLKVVHLDGSIADHKLTISVASVPGPKIDFRADSTKINVAECTMLRWDVDNAKAVYVSDGKAEAGVKGHDSAKVCLTHSTTYVLRVTRLDNKDERREVRIEVRGGQHNIDFRADRTNLKKGECTVLRWDVDGAKKVTLDLGNGPKRVDSHSNAQVCPPQTTTYPLQVEWKDGGKDSRQVTIYVQQPTPVVITFGFNPTTIKPGESATLSWNVETARAVRLMRLIPGGQWENVPAMGSRAERPPQTTTYRLRVEGYDNSVNEYETILEVQGAQKPEVRTFGFDKRRIKAGECATLSWEVVNARAVQLMRVIPGGQWQNVPAVGSQQECPPQTTAYRLRVEGHDNGVSEYETILEVEAAPPPPPKVTFDFDKKSIKAGECATLSWNVQNARAVQLLMPPGGQWQDVPATGSQQECPAATETYVLKVEGNDNSVNEYQATLEVEAAPPPSP